MTNIMSKLQTLLHQHPSKQHRWLKLDVDTKEGDKLQQIYKSLNDAPIVYAAETRGGYHVILEKGSNLQKLYKLTKTINASIPQQEQWITIENNVGPMLAIPGTNQGGFTVQCPTQKWEQGNF